MDITVVEQSALRGCAVERLAAEERETAVAVDARTTQRIVGTLEVAVLEQRTASPGKRTEVQARDETAVAGLIAVAIADDQLRLHDGIGTPLPALTGVWLVVEVHVTIIAESEVLGPDVVTRDMQHREIALSPLRLSPV